MPRRNDISKILTAGSGPIPATAWALVLLVLFIPADACVVDLGIVHVTSNFQVIVKHVQQRVVGVGIAIYRSKGVEGEVEKNPLLRLATDKDGIVKVHDLQDGTYMVATEGPGQGSAVYAIVGAKAKGKAKGEVVLGWPAQEVVQTNHLSGQLLNSNVWTPFEKAVGSTQLELWTAGVQAPIAVQATSPNGEFQFPQGSPGIYILRVKAKGGPEGEIALDLLPPEPATRASLTLHLLETSCGLTYRRCSVAPSLVAASPYVRVVTAKGGPFVRAAVRLEDSQGRVVAEGKTDDDGNIRLPEDLSGDFRFRLARGDISVDQPLHFTHSGRNDLAQSTPMAIQFDGVCSRLSAEDHATAQ
jgi:hypothetical protein